MPYDPNGFNFQGESVLNLYNTSHKYGSESVTLSNFKKNGTDLSTLITPACYNSNGILTTGTKTANAYKGFPDKIMTFDTAFSATAPDLKGRIHLYSYHDTWSSSTVRRLLDGHNGFIMYTYTTTLGSAKAINVLRFANSTSLDILVVGGGGGGASSFQNPNGSAGCGGGGAGALVTAKWNIPNSYYHTFSVSGGTGGAKVASAWSAGFPGSNTIFTLGGYDITAHGGQGGSNQDGRYDNPGGSSTGAAPHGWSGDINRSWYAGNLPGDGYSNNNPNLSSITVYRNRGGDCIGYGWSGGGGGGAGGVGGPHQGGYNRYGGHGGSAKSLHGKDWAGGGGGSGDNYFNAGWGNGNHGGAQEAGSGSGGNSTVGDGANWSWNTSSGWSGSGTIIVNNNYFYFT